MQMICVFTHLMYAAKNINSWVKGPTGTTLNVPSTIKCRRAGSTFCSYSDIANFEKKKTQNECFPLSIALSKNTFLPGNLDRPSVFITLLSSNASTISSQLSVFYWNSIVTNCLQRSHVFRRNQFNTRISNEKFIKIRRFWKIFFKKPIQMTYSSKTWSKISFVVNFEVAKNDSN